MGGGIWILGWGYPTKYRKEKGVGVGSKNRAGVGLNPVGRGPVLPHINRGQQCMQTSQFLGLWDYIKFS